MHANKITDAYIFLHIAKIKSLFTIWNAKKILRGCGGFENEL
jgi:hypothetical protein